MRCRILGTSLAWGLLVASVCGQEAPTPPTTKLFNGKDLKGWKVYPSGTGAWKVEDGVIVGSGRASHLFTERGDFENFHLKAEVMVNEGGNSGLYFRTQYGPGFPRGYEAQINSTHRDPIKTGSLYPGFDRTLTSAVRDKLLITDMLIKPGEWFTYEIMAKGDDLEIKVNGKTTVKYTDSKRTYQRGHFAFQQHHDGSEVKIRKVEVAEWKSK